MQAQREFLQREHEREKPTPEPPTPHPQEESVTDTQWSGNYFTSLEHQFLGMNISLYVHSTLFFSLRFHQSVPHSEFAGKNLGLGRTVDRAEPGGLAHNRSYTW